jgi:hypothetical protein
MVAGEALEAEAVGIEAMELKAEKDASKRRAAAIGNGEHGDSGALQGQGQKRKFVAATIN